MRTFVITGLLALGMLLNLNAQSTGSFKNETIEFIKLTGAANAFKNAIDQIGQMVPEDKKAAFYKTDLGEKLANKQIELSQKAMELGQSWGMQLQAIAQKYQ